MNNEKKHPVTISLLDIQMMIAVGICLPVAMLFPQFQTMTACIAVLLCTQEGVKSSWRAGLTRLIVTAVGGLIGLSAVLADNAIGNPWVSIAIVTAGIPLTLFGCRLAGAPFFNSRIGGATFILVVLTKAGTDRISYAVFRLLSTLYGVAVVIVVTALFSLFTKKHSV